MFRYILRRLLIFAPLLLVISLVSFAIIQLPRGDFVTRYIAELEASGMNIEDTEALARQMRTTYSLDRPVAVQYVTWIYRIIRFGDLGRSFAWQQPVRQILADRMGISILISSCALVFAYAAAIPIGIYSALHQYSFADYLFTFVGFIGLALPNFLLALLLLFIAFNGFGVSLAGLFSPEYQNAPWTVAKVWDLLRHLWIPTIVVGTAGTASLIRVVRGSLLDELRKQYVVTARAKGVAESRLTWKYPVRVAINPVLSTIGWILPVMISGETITSIVLNLPSLGPVLLRATTGQDVYLAAGGVLVLSSLAIVGSLLSDLLIAWADPRIRLQRGST